MTPNNEIICGAMPEATKIFPDGYFNCCISSPPYWALRDYGVEGQLGLEPTFEEYIDKLCTIYDEVKRVLRDDGTCWVNLGDTYGTSSGAGSRAAYKQGTNVGSYYYEGEGRPGVKGYDKSLCLIPQRFAIEMVNRGWILRNVIIWHKPNPMPSSAKDRFTVDFEYVYFFVKQKKYWFETQYEPQSETSHARYATGLSEPPPAKPDSKELNRPGYENWRETTPVHKLPLGRNKRCVWTIPTQPFPEAHFATYPEKLVEPMIKAGCPEFVCKKCGKGREKIYEKGKLVPDEPQYKPRGRNKPEVGVKTAMTPAGSKQGHPNFHYESKFKGYTDCGCNAGQEGRWRPGIVLDCFRRERNLAVCSCAA